MQLVADVHDTPSSCGPVTELDAGLCRVHVLPFQTSASTAGVSDPDASNQPTAMHFPLLQDTASSTLSVTPAMRAVVRKLQLVPFQVSAKPASGSAPDPKPIATQLFDAKQETPRR
jgi:hypothetical protein